MKAVLVGLLFSNLCLTFLKKKSTPSQVIHEQNIIVKSVEVITAIYLTMAPNLQVKDIATTACVWFLNPKVE
jgi:bacteriorhodopsin